MEPISVCVDGVDDQNATIGEAGREQVQDPAAEAIGRNRVDPVDHNDCVVPTLNGFVGELRGRKLDGFATERRHEPRGAYDCRRLIETNAPLVLETVKDVSQTSSDLEDGTAIRDVPTVQERCHIADIWARRHGPRVPVVETEQHSESTPRRASQFDAKSRNDPWQTVRPDRATHPGA